MLPSESKDASSSGRYCASLILFLGTLPILEVKWLRMRNGAEGERVHASLQYYTKLLAKCPDSGGGAGGGVGDDNVKRNFKWILYPYA